MSDVPEDVRTAMDKALSEDEACDPSEKNWTCRSWATREQWGWLMRTRPAYLAARKTRHPGKYLETMYSEFLEEWSECQRLYGHRDESRLSPEELEVLAEAVKKKKKQLRLWHKNRDRTRPSTRPLSSLLAAIGVTKKASRLPQPHEQFSKEFYQTDVRPLVRARTKELEAELGRKLVAGERLNNVRVCTKEVYEASSREVREDIAERLRKAKADAEAGRTGRVVGIADPDDRTPQQYQDAIELGPQIVEQVFKPYATASGWTFTVMGAGPVPMENGKIGSISAHFGHREGSINFAQALGTFTS
ncbi:hypothetical protein L226DRAFT_574281 [Lentinus tigrinus ALCF2SS1-7]|uniref:Uncharacterized protein n=1 Tax=Lentinus tigrinus ALCF2SS1-6 TaxID=1328759 RepID=A0A5C2RZ72_9APHY|nr:hypothetical protein L227DRAFT_614668 [Lentinus tigrinus ALCF2SS1-6]RPD71055.1 hypothetical protein L226DRAFT_574281 [Lentinus tigrinus ALCF2SS1-7]